MLFAFLLAYYELDSELKCDMRQVEFFIKGNLAQEAEIIEAIKQDKNKSSLGNEVKMTNAEKEQIDRR